MAASDHGAVIRPGESNLAEVAEELTPKNATADVPAPETPAPAAAAQDEELLTPKDAPEAVTQTAPLPPSGPIAWMVARTMRIQAKLQEFFSFQARLVCKHPKRCIWGVVIWINLIAPAALLGQAELRNEEVLLPQDARELEDMNRIRGHFGPSWGRVSLILTPTSGGDILTEPLITDVASTEAQVLSLTADDPDDASKKYAFVDACEPLFPQYVDGTAGPCFYMSLFSPNTPWNQPDPATGKYNSTANVLATFLTHAAALKAENPAAPVDGIHLAATQLLAQSKTDMFVRCLRLRALCRL